MNLRKKQIVSIMFITLIVVAILIIPITTRQNEHINNDDTIEPEITFSAFWSSIIDEQWVNYAIANEITRRTGVALDLVHAGDFPTETAKVMLASNNYPEILLSINNDTVSMYADANALYEMDDFIYNDSLNIKRIFKDDLKKMRFDNNGAIYGVNRQYKSIPTHANGIFNVQYALLEEFDYPEIRTLDQLYDYMVEYITRYPEINNNKTLGFTFYTQSYGFNVTLANAAAQAGGFQNDGLFCIDDSMNVKYSILTEQAKQYFGWLNKLYLTGILDESALLQNKDALTDKARTGQLLVIAAENWDIKSINSEMRQNEQNHRAYLPMPLTLNEDIETKASYYDPLGSWKSVVTKNCKNPEQAFSFFDIMWSEEMQILCNWGIEGTHYVVEDGKRIIDQEIYESSNRNPTWINETGLMLFNYWSFGDNVIGDDGQYIKPMGNKEDIIKTYDSDTLKILEQYDIELLTGLFPSSTPSTRAFAWKLVLPSNSAGAQAEDKVDSIRRKIVPKIIFSKDNEEFEKYWLELVESSNKAGINIREREIHDKLQQWIDIE